MVDELAALVNLGVAIAPLLHCRDVGAELIIEGLAGVGEFRGACWAIAQTNWVIVRYYRRGG